MDKRTEINILKFIVFVIVITIILFYIDKSFEDKINRSLIKTFTEYENKALIQTPEEIKTLNESALNSIIKSLNIKSLTSSGVEKNSKIINKQKTNTTKQDKTSKNKKEKIVFPVDINTATSKELIAIPGIGEVLSKRIIDYREKNGPFKSLEDLVKVKGIGEKTLEKIKPYIKIGNE
jgi:comEA protein